MAIYKMVGDKDKLDPVRETSFIDQNITESPDLRYILRAQPEVIEEGLFILGEEFSFHSEGPDRRIDLLALDAKGQLVVIELKRTRTGDHAELQAIRYAARVSILKPDELIHAHREYMVKWGIEGDPGERIHEHLLETDSGEIYTESPRIILVSEGFSKELTTSVLWLNENGLDITCIQLQPYISGSELLLESSQIIPVRGAEELVLQAQERRTERRKQRSSQGRQESGGEAFEASIEQASDSIRPKLQELYELACSLQKKELAQLTSQIRSNTSLQIRVPGKRALITVQNRIRENSATVLFYADDLRSNAAQATRLLDQTLGTNIATTKNNTVNRTLNTLPPVTWDILTEAYREANGRLNPETEPSISEN